MIGQRLGRFLERRGLPEHDVENSYLAAEIMEAGLLDLLLDQWNRARGTKSLTATTLALLPSTTVL